MPAFILSSTTCAISGKVIKPGDTIVRFTLWPASNPLGLSHDDVALRSEFNSWVYKEAATEKLSQAWRENFLGLRNSIVIHDDEYYLLTSAKRDVMVTIWFLKHAFYFGILKRKWSQFAQQIKRNQDEALIELSPERQLAIKKDDERVRICYRVHPLEQGLQDCIEISPSEWFHLLSIVSANKQNEF